MRLQAEFNVTRADQIDLDAMAEAQHAEISYEELDGATARVIQIGDQCRIVVSSRITDLGAQRFSIAHEIGHVRLRHEIPPGQMAQLFERICTPLQADRRKAEREASVFATELLMPAALVRPWCEVPCLTLAASRAIAGEFATSVLASTMRLVELSGQRCAVAYSELGRVRWVKPSPTFPTWIPNGRRLDPASAAFEYSQKGTIDREPHVLPAETWLPRDKIDSSGAQIVEHSAVVTERGAVFSLLWIPDREVRHLDLVP